MPRPLLRRSVASRGLWALTDQGLHSGSSLVLNLALARWLPAEEYGLFALAFSFFLLASIVHTSLLVEPMLVFGAGRFRRAFPSYLRTLLELQGGVTLGLLVLTLAVSGGAAALGASTSWSLLTAGSILAASAILTQWFLRRACYVHGKSALAASTSALYAVVIGVGVLALHEVDALSTSTAFGLMGVAAIVSGAVPFLGLGVGAPAPSRRLRRVVRSRHSRFGRWTLLTNGFNWIPTNAFFVVLTAAAGLQATATFRALFNVIMPMQHASVALSLVLVPALVRRRGAAADALTRRASFGFGMSAIAFAIILLSVKVPLLDFLYAGRYTADADLLWGLALIPVLGALNLVWRARLLADERPDAVFRAFVAGAIVTLAAGVPLVLWFGLTGAVIGRVIAACVVAGVLWHLQRAYLSSGEPGCAPPERKSRRDVTIEAVAVER